MGNHPDRNLGRRAVWSVLTTVVLVVRVVATIVATFCVFAWIVAAFRDSLMNPWLWWAVGSVIAIVVSTYLYSYLRVRYPSASERWEE
ncbi:hypothetical protein SAMN04488550_4469 [Gordonia malaquae]|jgi:uncharacterized BrkB/YihY/UPF0761 family membrane protein|uniref:Uncharacterized protein n=1 Tax=Gordonia malaquae NBRC 108250 TaxID=1223542 RepID=M3VBX4_GORML|nr:hypothetical protein [Gordonia malaquae]MDR2279681.1 hypothetical protein [Gordonia sp. (in: high G+C Gram-positive bacteria)]GAC81018.1 hypothetical protein GM1_025_00660 [Gordonia malaquae NBRC 108250]SEE39919.1 hypothetical protein SAMN04488550_4469 [Gordonia malaquae]